MWNMWRNGDPRGFKLIRINKSTIRVKPRKVKSEERKHQERRVGNASSRNLVESSTRIRAVEAKD